MKLPQKYAIQIEFIVSGVCNCGPEGLCGLVSADTYSKRPLEAAIECITFLSPKNASDELCEYVSSFFTDWVEKFDQCNDDIDCVCRSYIEALSDLVNKLRISK